MGRRLALTLVAVVLAACADGSDVSILDGAQLAARTRNPCRNVTCWNHAACQVTSGAATCVCDSGYVASGLTCVAQVTGNDSVQCGFIPTTGMTASATSAEPGYEPALVLDGSVGTFWHTPWETTTWGPTLPLPQSITIDLGATWTVSGLTYQPPGQSNANGIITAFTIYLSNDGQSFTPVAAGTWAQDASAKTVSFAPGTATHVRLEATEGYGGFAAAGEINVERCPVTSDPLPEPQPQPGPSSTWTPPGTHYHVNAGMSVGQIQAVIDGTGTGNTVVFDPGTYNFGGGTVRGRSDTTFYAPDVVEITNAGGAGTQGAFDFTALSGFWLLGAAPEHGFSLSTFIDVSSAADFHVGNMRWHDVPGDVGYHASAIQMHDAVRFEIVNSDFVNGSGNFLLGWSIDNATFDGLHMQQYHQGIDLGFGSSHDRGRNVAIRRMVSTGVERMPIETVGEDAYGRDFLVEDSWFDDFGPADGGGVAISVVHRGDVQGLIVRNNFIRRGSRTFNSIGVEWQGDGGGSWYNDIRDMAAGIIFYGTNYDAQYNNVTNAAWGTIVDYSGTVRGNIANNTSDDTRPIPPQPQRRVWP